MVRYLLAGVLTLSFFLSAGLAYADASLNDVFTELEQLYGLPSGILGKIANVESGGNATLGSNSSSAYGMFQWTAASWYSITKVAYGTSLDLAQRANPVTSAKMTAISLKQAENQNASLINQANIDLTVGLYLCHFLGAGGCNKFFQLYIQNPNQSASAAFPREAAANPTVLNGRTLAGVVNYYSQKLNGIGSAVNVAGNFADANGISLAYSDADVSPSSFMSSSFVPPTQDPYHTYQTNYSALQQTQSLTPFTQLSQPQLTPQIANIGQPVPAAANNGNTSQSSGPVPPAALIIAQPSSVPRGYNLVVSWATTGMSSCQVSQQGVQISFATSSSRSVKTSSIQSGTVTFVLSCIAQSGQSVQQSASASVF
ncbi:MAG TPA: transglycosylase SLT domain-containing protein [Candidatus Paceibacterota bacterium]|nr:transglycosylase SLT domain-containing protein [Candidatus Paceibacterota bacterium]